MSELASAVKEASENATGSSPDDFGTIEEMPEDTILSRQTSVSLVPCIGQRFVSQDAAYEFYCSFAKQCGFSIRRHRTRGREGVGRGITRRDFTCHRGGFPQLKPSDDGKLKLQRNRKSSRCGCQAYMRIVKRADYDIPEWRITAFSNVHNHEQLKTIEVQLLPAYCTISPDDKSRICMFSKAGMSVRQMLRLLELEKGVKLGSLPFTEVDVRNLLQSFRSVDGDNDSIDLLTICKNRKDKEHDFKYDFKMDANNRLEHIAWSYPSCIQSYETFGDCVIFDTTHRLDAYDMLLGLWVGVDNHGMSCLFGCVLLRDENVQSFAWALKSFLGFMNNKSPQALLTDENMWLKDAVSVEMPQTKHAFCIWHITAKFSDWFSGMLGSLYDKWKADFQLLYNLQCVEDFEVGWLDMVNTYGLHGNKHISSLYALRTFWALPYLRGYFFAGMTKAFHSESINAYTRRFLSVQSKLMNYVDQVAAIANYKDQIGSKDKMQQKIQKFSLKTGSPIEAHAASVLTPYAFNILQEELVLAPQYASLMVDENYFIVRHHTKLDGGYKVLWSPNDEFISCSCQHFEFSGILCRHVLRVLSTNNCFHIQNQYLPARWREEPSARSFHQSSSGSDEKACKVQLLKSMVSNLVAQSAETEEQLDTACNQVALLLSRIKGFTGLSVQDDNHIAYHSPSASLMIPEVEDSDSIVQSYSSGPPQDSYSLGKLKERRPRDSMDAYKKRRRCSVPYWGQFEHNAAECQMISDDLSGDGMGFL